MSNAYWHVKLTEESSHLTTFHTPWGRKRFFRMPFGISSASEVLQKPVGETFRDIDGVHVIHDDMIIAGSDEANHDMIVHKVMKKASQNKVKFNNKNLSQFKVNKVKYMGNYYSEDGLLPDPDKIKSIVEMLIPDGKPALNSSRTNLRWPHLWDSCWKKTHSGSGCLNTLQLSVISGHCWPASLCWNTMMYQNQLQFKLTLVKPG